MKEKAAQFHFVPAEIYPEMVPRNPQSRRYRPIEGDMLMLLDDDHAYVPHAIGEVRGCCALRFSIKTHVGMGYLLDVYEQDGTPASKITRRF